MDKKTTFILILMLVNLVFGGTELNGPVSIDNVPAYGSTATKYLIIDGSDSIVKSRTNTQVLSDIGGASIAALNLKLNISDTSVFARDVDLDNYMLKLGLSIAELNDVGANIRRLISPFSSIFNALNNPTGANYWTGFEFRHNLSDDYRTQIATGSTGSTGSNLKLAIRNKTNGVWNNWYYVWHDGNFDPATKEDTSSNRLWRRVAPNTGVNTLTGFSATRSHTNDTGAPGSYFSVVHFNPVANTNKYDFDLASRYSNTSDFYLRAKHDTPDTNKVWCRLWTDNNLDTVPFARDGQAMTPVLHQHDSIYYRESEVNTLLNGKASTSHASTHLRGGSDVIAGEEGYGIYRITSTDAWYTGINYGGLGIGSNDGTNRQMMTFTDGANDTQAVFSVITSTDGGVNWANKFKVTRSGRIKSADIPALGTAATTYLVSNNGTISSRTASQVKSDIGLGNVNNTSDLNKPISTATQTALNGKASTSHASTHLSGGSDQLFDQNLSTTNNVTFASQNITDGTNTLRSVVSSGVAYISSVQSIDMVLRRNNSERLRLTSNGVKMTIPALGTAATTYLVSNNGTISSRTAAQVLSDIGAQTKITGTANRILKVQSGGTGVTTTNLSDDGTNVVLNSSTSGAVSSPVKLSIGVNQWSNGYTRDKLKLELAEGFGFTTGPALDLQYHATNWHDFYNDNSKIFRIGKDSVVVNGNLSLSGDIHNTIPGGLSIYANGNEVLRIRDHKLGVNNTNPDSTLTVTGGANIAGGLKVGSVFRSFSDSVQINKPLQVHDTLNIYDQAYGDKMSIYCSNRSQAGIINTPYYGLEFRSNDVKYFSSDPSQTDINSARTYVNANGVVSISSSSGDVNVSSKLDQIYKVDGSQSMKVGYKKVTVEKLNLGKTTTYTNTTSFAKSINTAEISRLDFINTYSGNVDLYLIGGVVNDVIFLRLQTSGGDINFHYEYDNINMTWKTQYWGDTNDYLNLILICISSSDGLPVGSEWAVIRGY